MSLLTSISNIFSKKQSSQVIGISLQQASIALCSLPSLNVAKTSEGDEAQGVHFQKLKVQQLDFSAAIIESQANTNLAGQCHIVASMARSAPPKVFTDSFYAGGEVGDHESQGVRLVVGGMTCVDWRQNGDKKGFAGASTKPAQVSIEQRRARHEPFWIIECVYSEHLIKYVNARLRYLSCIDWVLVNPSHFRYPVSRDRMFLSGLLLESVRRTRPCPSLMRRRLWVRLTCYVCQASQRCKLSWTSGQQR